MDDNQPKLTYLGEIFQVTEEFEDIVDAVITKGSKLSHGQRLYFESADFEVSGSTILQRHENTSPDGIPERLRLDNILLRHRNLSPEQANQYKSLMLRADFTYPAAITEIDNRMRKEGVISTLSWLETIASEMEKCDVGEEDWSHPLNRGESIPPTYGFHRIDSIYIGEIELPWMLKQPELVRRLITTPNRCMTLTQLRNLGKGCYSADKERNPAPYQNAYLSMTNIQRTIFWDRYRISKEKLYGEVRLSATANALIRRIRTYKKEQMPRLKANLVRLQKGQIIIKNQPTEDEWEVIWYQFTQKSPTA